MIVIPAVDLRGGKCVRLKHGDIKEETVYSDDPVAFAKKWVAQGAKRLHVIDLDGAISGEQKNLEIALRIKKEAGVMVQFGGGVRSKESLDRILKAGIDRVILGTIVFEEAGLAKEAFDAYREHIMVALDVRDGMIATRGWKQSSGFPLEEGLHVMEKLGGKEVIFTDISRDGTLEGANIEAVKKVMTMTPMGVYASGGISSLDDLRALKALEAKGLKGAILGKSLYAGKINLPDALAIAK
jgi:phosphoribosylformimino-5-aminoimidazole carboxamide ribotide isomerase